MLKLLFNVGLVSMPGLMIFNATLRRTGFVCSAM
jgi:hypothetical protein